MSGRIKFDGPTPFLHVGGKAQGRDATHRWETNDCGPNALALALDIPYSLAHALLKRAGRKDKKGTWPGEMGKVMGAEIKNGNVQHMPLRGTLTLGAFVRALNGSEGRYLVSVRGHYLAIVDGVVADWRKPQWKQKIECLYRTLR